MLIYVLYVFKWKVGAFVNPLRSSMRQKMNKVKSVPDALFGDVLDGFGKMLTKVCE